MRVDGQPYRTVWMEKTAVKMIHQPSLPHRFEIYTSPTHETTAAAIRDMIVRGAPAIGATAAYGMAQVYAEAARLAGDADAESFIEEGCERLRSTRPTAQNLFHALDRIRAAAEAESASARRPAAARAEADRLADDEAEACRRIGEHGAHLIADGATILTHCNAGWLACVDWGTALAPIYAAHRAGRRLRVLADETRPRCQGANLTAWELMHEGVDVAILADNAAGWLMQRAEIDCAIVGADRIAANGDAANKIGTYEKAVLARRHGIPFYVAAPVSTFDPACPSGDAIPIEERDADEVLFASGRTDDGQLGRVRLAPEGASARNPAFDVTPVELITGFITERGLIDPTPEAVARLTAAPTP